MPRPRRNHAEIAHRKAELLAVAQRLLITHGPGWLTMDRFAAATEFSKGTIYQVFSSKDDVIAALAEQTTQRRVAFFERAAVFPGRSRERMHAIAKAYEITSRLYPDECACEEACSLAHVRQYLPERRRRELEKVDNRAFEITLGILRDGISSGDLKLTPSAPTPEMILFGLFGLTKGIYRVWISDLPFHEWASDVFETHFGLINLMCDGYGWRPFTNEWDYQATKERIWKDVFPAEYALLNAKKHQTR